MESPQVFTLLKKKSKPQMSYIGGNKASKTVKKVHFRCTNLAVDRRKMFRLT